MDESDVSLGKFISLILRHNPGAIGITLDEHGWADVNEMIRLINEKSRFSIDRPRLDRIVAENNKHRYSYSEDGTRIRANQGHSVKVDVELKEAEPPVILYHGTGVKSLDGIMREGAQADVQASCAPFARQGDGL